MIRRDKAITLQQTVKEDLIKPIVENLENDDFSDDIQESYIKNRMKRISQNSCRSENSININ